MLVLFFPLIENFIMKQHALVYSFDRMKGLFLLTYLVCEVARNILDYFDSKKVIVTLLAITALMSYMNLKSYTADKTYIWPVDYQAKNKQIAAYVTAEYPNAIYITESYIRGYENLLFGRGIYGVTNLEAGLKLAREASKPHVVSLSKDVSVINGISVTKVANSESVYYTVENNKVVAH